MSTDKRIGILCFYGVPNYGAWAQAYALNNVIKVLPIGDEGLSVEHINYISENHYLQYYQNDKKLENTFTYTWNSIKSTKRLSVDTIKEEKFDVVVTGADAIWDFSVDIFGKDDIYVCNGINAKKYISYAPSCGMMSPDYKIDEAIKKALLKYSNISVRDDNSAGVVEKLTGRRPEIVLDPVLLWDFENDPKVQVPIFEKYMVVYGGNFSEEFILHAKNFASKKKCKLISVGYIHKWCDISYRMTELRGLEWIGMFKGAECVITSMFHGFMLGLSFKKDIKFYNNPYVKKRAATLMKELDLSVYLKDNVSNEDIFEYEFDYEEITLLLERLREKSFTYLLNALKEN